MREVGARREDDALLARKDRPGSYGTLDEESTSSEDSWPNATSTSALPMKQLLVIFIMRLAEPIAYTQVFPYINEVRQLSF